MIDNSLKAAARYSLYDDRIELFLKRGKCCGVVQFETEYEHGLAIPANMLEREDAQQIVDALWSAGIRPTQARNSEGVTAAQERHLADMRALAFAKLKVERP